MTPTNPHHGYLTEPAWFTARAVAQENPMNWEPNDLPNLSDVPLAELQRIVGILMCEQMLYLRPAEVEAEINWRLGLLETEISRRLAVPELARTG